MNPDHDDLEPENDPKLENDLEPKNDPDRMISIFYLD